MIGDQLLEYLFCITLYYQSIRVGAREGTRAYLYTFSLIERSEGMLVRSSQTSELRPIQVQYDRPGSDDFVGLVHFSTCDVSRIPGFNGRISNSLHPSSQRTITATFFGVSFKLFR